MSLGFVSLVTGTLLVMSQDSAVAPLIYTLFWFLDAKAQRPQRLHLLNLHQRNTKQSGNVIGIGCR